MISDDTTYFEQRANQELELAQTACDPAAVRAHYILANHYLDKVHGGPGLEEPFLAHQIAA